MKKLIYISVAALTLISSQIAYASPKKLTEKQVISVTAAVCNSPTNASESQIEKAVENYADINTDPDKLVTMQDLAIQMLVLPDTTMTTICEFF
ncbi:MAG: hypothetical protein QNJ60_08040 [Xenococcaceae cyanobacterium MO_188.B19]|nr:hypothetical protein [Xenococcaceae cyanobacterium MO_188.B19]